MWRLEKSVDEIAIGEERMAVFAVVFGSDSPEARGERAEKGMMQALQRGRAQWRAIDGRDDGRVAAAVEQIAQTDLQRTELAVFRSWITDEISAACTNLSGDGIGVPAGNDDVEAREVIESQQRRGEQRVARRIGRARRRRRPREHRLVGSHARGVTGRENEPGELYGSCIDRR